ncbi:hypothetical protein GGR53DRAFT_494117 [Hypoxylon sp. FL1150]|nr:hypothetical protein GGR53DRAFT_494117 [Hypoxylon sp. FL1150]
MLFSILMLLACTAIANTRDSTSNTVVDPDPITLLPDPTTSHKQTSTKSINDCDGSTMCSTLHVKACDIAINFKVIRDDNPNYGSEGCVNLPVVYMLCNAPRTLLTYTYRSGAPRRGECHGLSTDWGCGILIQGPSNCTRSGNEMWWDYQDIRRGGCHHCGHKYWTEEGCKTTIDYFPVCGIWH